jgi:hypothetical protein
MTKDPSELGRALTQADISALQKRLGEPATPDEPTIWERRGKAMTRREQIEEAIKGHPGMIHLLSWDLLIAEIRALWAVEQEYSAAIELGGGTIPPALAAYREGQESDTMGTEGKDEL